MYTSINERQFARLLHRSSTFPASARTAVWRATLLTLKLDSAEVSLYRYGVVAVRSAASVPTVMFIAQLYTCHVGDMKHLMLGQHFIGRSCIQRLGASCQWLVRTGTYSFALYSAAALSSTAFFLQ